MAAYRALIIGMGKRGKHHAAAFHANPSFEVAGLCDVFPEPLPALAETLGNPAVGSDAAAMAAELKPDVFCFCTHPNLRLELLRIGVEAGAKLIAFEKPVAMTSREAREMRALLAGSESKAVVSHQHRYGSHYRKVKEIVDSGALGRIQSLYATTPGWMLHMCTHLIDYLRWYNNGCAAEWVMAQAAGKGKFSDNHPSPDYIAGVIHFANGVHAYIECGAGAPDQPEVGKWWGKNRIGVQGTEGFAEVLTNGGWRAVTRDGVLSGEGVMNYDVDMPPYVQEMADWLDGKIASHACAFDNAYAGFEVMAGLCRSAARGGQVALPLVGEGDELGELQAAMSDAPAIFGFPASAAEFK